MENVSYRLKYFLFLRMGAGEYPNPLTVFDNFHVFYRKEYMTEKGKRKVFHDDFDML